MHTSCRRLVSLRYHAPDLRPATRIPTWQTSDRTDVDLDSRCSSWQMSDRAPPDSDSAFRRRRVSNWQTSERTVAEPYRFARHLFRQFCAFPQVRAQQPNRSPLVPPLRHSRLHGHIRDLPSQSIIFSSAPGPSTSTIGRRLPPACPREVSRLRIGIFTGRG